MAAGEVWQLRHRGEPVGDITLTAVGRPWWSGDFAPRPGFAAVAPLFAEELALSRVLEEGYSDAANEQWEATRYRIAQAVTLVGPAGPVPEFLLHIDGDAAWFRYREGSFDGA
jgi:hypothetical protein